MVEKKNPVATYSTYTVWNHNYPFIWDLLAVKEQQSKWGALADNTARLFRLDKSEREILIISGISAGFSSVFGTPLAEHYLD